jgi:predicted transcriptional regulator
MEGEGLEDAVPFSRLLSLLNTTNENLLFHLRKNIETGYLKIEDEALSKRSSVKLTATGKKEAGGIFRNAFEGMQKGGHGECGPDCEFCYLEGEKLEDCVHNCADTRHHH